MMRSRRATVACGNQPEFPFSNLCIVSPTVAVCQTESSRPVLSPKGFPRRREGPVSRLAATQRPEMPVFQRNSQTLLPAPILPAFGSALHCVYPAGTGSRDLPQHAGEQPPRQMTLRQQQPVVACVFDQAVRRSSPTAAASWSATSWRPASAAPAAATSSPGYRRSGSATAAPRWRGSGGSKAASSRPPACLP